MSTFDEAYDALLKVEGGYVNDPDDPGGETYKGISRHYWPNWSGWAVVDKLKKEPGFPRSLSLSKELDINCRFFYRVHFWDRLSCDSFTKRVAEELFEQTVNRSFASVVRDVQSVCNAINVDQQLFTDLIIDGKYGPKTVAAIEAVLRQGYGVALALGMNSFQGVHYVEQGLRNPVMRKYVVGWLVQRVKMP